MNLIGDPWIPVVDATGATREVGLAALFQEADDLVDLALRPIQRVAVMRLLLAVTYAARGAPIDAAAWAACRTQLVPGVMAYLQQRTDCFELYGDRTFLQIPSLERKQNAVVDKLDLGLSAGNRDTLFDHAARPEGRSQEPGWCALHLLTYQCCSPGGLVGALKWGHRSTGRSSEHAPAVEGAALQAFVRGATLLDTIHMNLVPQDLLPAELGTPIWEIDVSDADAIPVRESSETVLGRLVPISRAVRLEPGSPRFALGNGLSYPKLADGARETAATVVARRDGKGHGYLRVDLAKHPWRELASILALGTGEDRGDRWPCRTSIAPNSPGRLMFWVGGLAADRAKVIDEAEWNLTVPMELLDDGCMLVYRGGVELAERGAGALGGAVRTYTAFLNQEPGGVRDRAVRSYWSALDQQYEVLVAIGESRSDLDSWRRVLLKAMEAAYSEVCPATTPRQIEAFVAGRRRLHLPQTEEQQQRHKEEHQEEAST